MLRTEGLATWRSSPVFPAGHSYHLLLDQLIISFKSRVYVPTVTVRGREHPRRPVRQHQDIRCLRTPFNVTLGHGPCSPSFNSYNRLNGTHLAETPHMALVDFYQLAVLYNLCRYDVEFLPQPLSQGT